MFGNKEKKAAQDGAAQEALDRLLALSPAELAAAILPAFSPGAVSGSGGRVNALLAANFLSKQGPRVSGGVKTLLGPAQAGLQALEHGGLITHGGSPAGSTPSYIVTDLGRSVLADGSVREHLS